MAFGTGSRSFPPNSKLYSFAIKTKGLPVPVFHVSKKNGDEYELLTKTTPTGETIPDTASRVSGNIISAAHKENKHEGKTIKSVNLTLQDGNDIYFVSVGYTFLGRNLFNSLLGLKTYDDIEIGLYQSKPKPDAVNRTGFASVALRQHTELVRGPYDTKKDMPATKKVRLNGVDTTDTYDLDCWFEEKMKGWCKAVNTAAAKASTVSGGTSSEAPSSEGAEEASSAANDEDPPF